MWQLRLVPQKTKIGFIRWRMVSALLSTILILASVGLFATNGLNYGIDFKGGSLIEFKTAGSAELGQVRALVGEMNLGDVQVQEFGAADTVLVIVETQPGGVKVQDQVVDQVVATLNDNLDGGITVNRREFVSGGVSQELVRDGTMAVVFAILAMLAYIWFRFEWQFSVGAVLALLHDVVLTIGVFSLVQLEFGLPIIAALLTIVGYSMNDTVVVYDRVRENLRKYKKMPLSELLDLSVNDTLSRTIMTSVTTLIALGSLYVLGGENIRGFTFAMIWGIFVGTYSSIFIAAPLLLVLGVKRDWSEEAAKKAAAAQP